MLIIKSNRCRYDKRKSKAIPVSDRVLDARHCEGPVEHQVIELSIGFDVSQVDGDDVSLGGVGKGLDEAGLACEGRR